MQCAYVRVHVCDRSCVRLCVRGVVVGGGEGRRGAGVERAGSPPPLTVLSGRDLECVDYL